MLPMTIGKRGKSKELPGTPGNSGELEKRARGSALALCAPQCDVGVVMAGLVGRQAPTSHWEIGGSERLRAGGLDRSGATQPMCETPESRIGAHFNGRIWGQRFPWTHFGSDCILLGRGFSRGVVALHILADLGSHIARPVFAKSKVSFRRYLGPD